jgi:hypothetical protein
MSRRALATYHGTMAGMLFSCHFGWPSIHQLAHCAGAWTSLIKQLIPTQQRLTCWSRLPRRCTMKYSYMASSKQKIFLQRGELGCERKSVVLCRVGQVVAQVLQGALARDDGLHEEAKAAEHGQAPVLELLDLELRERVWVVSQAEGVERLAWVHWVQALASRAAVHTAALDGAHQHHLARQGGHDVLGVDLRVVARAGE